MRLCTIVYIACNVQLKFIPIISLFEAKDYCNEMKIIYVIIVLQSFVIAVTAGSPTICTMYQTCLSGNIFNKNDPILYQVICL